MKFGYQHKYDMNYHLPCITAAMLATGLATCLAADDIIIADFEGANFGNWKVTGDAFATGPAHGGLPNPWRPELRTPVDGYKGKGFASSFCSGECGIGSLTSPEFKIERKYLTFLIGGTKTLESCMNLLIAGKVVRVAGTSKDLPDDSETAVPGSWNVAEFAGQSAVIQIDDQAWQGHINVDQIVQTDVKPPPGAPKSPKLRLFADVKRDFKIDKRYLRIPIKNGVFPLLLVNTIVDGKVVAKNTIGLADAPPDWWACMDVGAWKGKTLTLQVEKMIPGSMVLDSIEQSDSIVDAATLYHEPLRAQLHFSPRSGWNTNPYGMVFSHGEYHLFYQCNPYNVDGLNMQWGHAVSSDMVHWKESQVLVEPHTPGDSFFSGSAVLDTANTAGWKNGTADLIAAAFTSYIRGVCIVYSNDAGRTFKECDGNPVKKHPGRDPRLLWHAPSKQWVMAVQADQGIAFHTSPDLKKWTYQSRSDGFNQCPDIFELALDGVASNKKWVLTSASGDYRVGTFDGKAFTPETAMLKGHPGMAYVAAQTFSNDPKGRTIQLAWPQLDERVLSFSQPISLPNQLTLRSTPAGPRLAWTPVEELKSLRAKSITVGALTLAPGAPNPLAKASAEMLELRATFTPPAKGEVRFTLRGIPIIYNTELQELVVSGVRVTVPLRDGKLDLTVFIDRTVFEVYAGGGLCYVPLRCMPEPAALGAEVAVTGGNVTFEKLEVHELKSIWTDK